MAIAGSGVNRADLLQRKGRYEAPPGWPADVPGLEHAGTVTAVGESVSQLRVGQKVFGIVGGGAHATHLLTPESLCAPLPEDLDPVVAGGVPEVAGGEPEPPGRIPQPQVTEEPPGYAGGRSPEE